MLQIRTDVVSALGYPTLVRGPARPVEITTDDYAADQQAHHAVVVHNYLLPIIERLGAHSVLDVGCGIGGMVVALHDAGVQAFGVDLEDNEPRWDALARPRDRFAIVDPGAFALPFDDGAFDFIYSFGVIEHVGTSNGHSDRLPNYHAIRRDWVRELYRVVRPGGHLLLGGPNRTFPVDAAHGCDRDANALERWIFDKTRLSVHRTWGEHFLWSYGDLRRYAKGLACTIMPQRIDGMIEFGRVPRLLRPLAQAYVRYMPEALLGTGANPWMLALMQRKDG